MGKKDTKDIIDKAINEVIEGYNALFPPYNPAKTPIIIFKVLTMKKLLDMVEKEVLVCGIKYSGSDFSQKEEIMKMLKLAENLSREYVEKLERKCITINFQNGT